MIYCCNQEMLIMDDWYHCRSCYKRLLEIPETKERMAIADLLAEYIPSYTPTWKELQATIKELWKEGTYEDYDAKLPKEWRKLL